MGNTLQVEILSGWKDIANYLHKGVRTVQRYERQMGLPVRRPAHEPRGSVLATKAELDAWVHASPVRNAFVLNRPTTPDALENLARKLEETRRLSEEMRELRLQVRESLELLHATICSVQLGRQNASHNESQSPLQKEYQKPN